MLDGSLASTKSVTPSLESNPLRCLDLFCGCGGLSLGLEMSHLTTCLWAVDADPTACKSFAANFRQATVYQSSAIDWLKELKTVTCSSTTPRKINTPKSKIGSIVHKKGTEAATNRRGGNDYWRTAVPRILQIK